MCTLINICILICLSHTPEKISQRLVYQHARFKLAIVSMATSILISTALTFLLYSCVVKAVWSVYPVNNVLIYLQIYLLIILLMGTVVIFLAVVGSCWFPAVISVGSLISVTAPLLSVMFLAHLAFQFHWFYLAAFFLTWIVTLVFFVFYEGYLKVVSDTASSQEPREGQT